jgi:hypothetical protein
MSRSRSSFDLSSAIATAESLTVIVPEEQPAAIYRSVPLVSFGPTASGPPTVVPPELLDGMPMDDAPHAVPPAPPPPDPAAVAGGPPAQAVTMAQPAEGEPGPSDNARRPPKLPDLSGVASPVQRCDKIIEWIAEAVTVSGVFIADASGLPLAGAIADAEARLAATGVVASAIAHLAAALPGNSSALFEMHVGDGPFFQLVGFDIGERSYVVGFQRHTPLGFRQAHAVRLACRHALAPEATSPSPTGEPTAGSNA